MLHTTPPALRARTERATALAMVPALLLVLVALGGVAVDAAVVHGAQRSLYRTLSAAADDAAAMVDTAELQTSGEVELDPDAAERVALAHLGVLADGLGEGVVAGRRPAQEILRSDVAVSGDSVTVTATVRVDHIMLGALPGTPDHTDVTVSATGRFRR